MMRFPVWRTARAVMADGVLVVIFAFPSNIANHIGYSTFKFS